VLHHPLQLSDPSLLRIEGPLTFKDFRCVLQKSGLPLGEEIWFDLMFAANLSHCLAAVERRQDGLGLREGRHLRRRELHKKIHRLHQSGYTICGIARRLTLSRTTVYR
jgi:hypothetical protein